MPARARTILLRGGQRRPPQRLSVCDIEPGAVVVRRAAAFAHRLDPERLLVGLRACLAELPLLAGRLRRGADGWWEVTCDDAGLRYTVVDEDRPMPAYGYDQAMKPDISRLTEPLTLTTVDRDRPLVGVRVTRFQGGTVLGLSNTHALMDGLGAWRLLERWSQHYRGHASAAPLTFDRAPLLPPTSPPPAAHRPAPPPPLSPLGLAGFIARALLATRTRASALLHLPAALLADAKAELGAQLPAGEWLSTQDVVMGLLVHGLAAATAQPQLHIGTIYDLRRIAGLGLTPAYTGNAATFRDLVEPRAELARTPLHLARALRRLAATLTPERALTDLRALEARVTPANALRHMPLFMRRLFADGLLLNNYSAFPIYRLDFGHGPPRWGDYPRLPLGRVLTVCPDPHGDGVAVHLTLPHDELRRFVPPRGAGPLHPVGA